MKALKYETDPARRAVALEQLYGRLVDGEIARKQILVDETSRGKTLEVIAFLLAHRKEGARPTLVVTPTSLMYNWMDEIERFAPDLKAEAIAGTKKEREEKLRAAGKMDVVVTTYNMLKRDISL